MFFWSESYDLLHLVHKGLPKFQGRGYVIKTLCGAARAHYYYGAVAKDATHYSLLHIYRLYVGYGHLEHLARYDARFHYDAFVGYGKLIKLCH